MTRPSRRAAIARQPAGTVRQREPVPPADASTSAPAPGIRSAAWQRRRREKLADSPACELAGPSCMGQATEVDHIVPRAHGGSLLDWSNLRSACAVCHVARHGKRYRWPTLPDGSSADPADPWNNEV